MALNGNTPALNKANSKSVKPIKRDPRNLLPGPPIAINWTQRLLVKRHHKSTHMFGPTDPKASYAHSGAA